MSTAFIITERVQQTTACLHAKSSPLSIFINAELKQAMSMRLHVGGGGGLHMQMIK